MQQLSLEVNEILKQKESLLSFYEELLIISWAKWDCRQKKGLHKLLVEKKEDLSQKAIYKTWKCYEWVNLSVFSLQNILKAHWSVASFKLILTEVNDVMNASQKTIESQRNTDDLTLTFMTEKRCNWKRVKVLTLHNIRKKLNSQKQLSKGLWQQHNELKSKWTSNKAKKKG